MRRDGNIGALAIFNVPVGERGTYLNDLWTNPRKAYRITDEDRIPGEDLSGQAVMEYLIRDTYRRGGELELLGGDTIARRWYFSKFGFGVKAPKPPPATSCVIMDYSEHECVSVNPRLGTTEREMFLPRDRQEEFLERHAGSRALIRSAPTPVEASMRTAVPAFSAATARPLCGHEAKRADREPETLLGHEAPADRYLGTSAPASPIDDAALSSLRSSP